MQPELEPEPELKKASKEEIIETIKKQTTLGTRMVEVGQLSQAAEHFWQAYKSAKQLNSPGTHRQCALNLGAVCLALDEVKLADKYINRALAHSESQTSPNTSSINSTYGSARWSSAEHRALIITDSNGDLFYNVALLNERKHNFSEAETWYESALAEYSRLEAANYYAIAATNEKLARLAERSDRTRDALTRYELAVNVYEKSIDSFLERRVDLPSSSSGFHRNETGQDSVVHAIACYYTALCSAKKLNDVVARTRLTDAFANLLAKLAAQRVRLNLRASVNGVLTDFVSSLHFGVLYYDLGLFCVESKQLEKAVRCFEAALELIRNEPLAQSELATLDDGCSVPFPIGKGKKTKQSARRADQQADISVRERYEPAVQQNLGALYNAVGDYQRAVPFHERAIALFTRLVDRLASKDPGACKLVQRSVAQSYANLAFSCFTLGQLDAAHAAYEAALRGARAASDVRTEWQTLDALATLCVLANRLDEAVSLLQEAVVAIGNDSLASASRNRYAVYGNGATVYSDYSRLYGSAATPEDTYYVQSEEPVHGSGEQRKLVAKLSGLLEQSLAQSPRNASTVSPTIPNRLLLTIVSRFETFSRRLNEPAQVGVGVGVGVGNSRHLVFPFWRWSLSAQRPKFSDRCVRAIAPVAVVCVCTTDLDDDDEQEVLMNAISRKMAPMRTTSVQIADDVTMQGRSSKLSRSSRRTRSRTVNSAKDDDVYETVGPNFRLVNVERVVSVGATDYGCVDTRRALPIDSSQSSEAPPLPPRRGQATDHELHLVEQVADADECVYGRELEEQSLKVATSAKDSLPPEPPVEEVSVRETRRNDLQSSQEEQADEEADVLEEDVLEEIDPDISAEDSANESSTQQPLLSNSYSEVSQPTDDSKTKKSTTCTII